MQNGNIYSDVFLMQFIVTEVPYQVHRHLIQIAYFQQGVHYSDWMYPDEQVIIPFEKSDWLAFQIAVLSIRNDARDVSY